MVVIDVDGERHPVEQHGVGDPRRVRAVDRDEHATLAIGGGSRSNPRSASSRKRYSPGRGAGPVRTMTLSFSSARSARWKASNDPRASPSGFSCDVTRKRSYPRRAASTNSMSLAAGILRLPQVSSELVDQMGQAHASLDRVIVREGELRGPA